MLPDLKILATMILLVPQASSASEAEFLRSLSGNWSGGGSYLRPSGAIPVTVRCNFKTSATVATLQMRGTCQALVILSRSLTADLKVSGTTYSGRYSGPEGEASLQGRRSGNSLNLTIEWLQPVRGDHQARMEIELQSPDDLTMLTMDLEEPNGKSILATNLHLRRDR
jgi:hypothetical protein